MKSKNIVYGLILILISIVLIFDNLNLFVGIDIISICLSILFLGISIYGFKKMNFYQALFPLSFICIIYDDELRITQITPWTILLSTLLLSIGLSIIFKKKINQTDNWNYIEKTNENKYKVFFSENVKYISGEVGYLDLLCVFGQMDIYLDKAIFKNAKIEINVNVAFGELKIFVPKNSRVNNSIDCILSESRIYGVSADNTQYQDILVKGMSLFGEVQIIYI